jgi:HD-like signal output (HDOD) protein
LPEVTARIMATVEDPRSSAASLHKIIAHDPALVARILKLVNSAFYGLPGQITSVDRAITLLGLNAVKNVAVAASLGQMFRGSKLCDGFSARDLWTHCVAVAVAARELARIQKSNLADEAFLGGMIHDIGILVALQAWPEKTRAVCAEVQTTGADFCQTEQKLLGVDHQIIGRTLAEQWKFPLACQEVAGFHHNPMSLEGSGRKLVCLMHVADTICCQQKQGFNLTAINQKLDEAILSEAGVDQAAIDKISTNLSELIANAAAVLA